MQVPRKFQNVFVPVGWVMFQLRNDGEIMAIKAVTLPLMALGRLYRPRVWLGNYKNPLKVKRTPLLLFPLEVAYSQRTLLR